MKVYVANFGRENYEWPECLARGTIATMNDSEVHPLWEAGDKEAFVNWHMGRPNRYGVKPIRAVASRWYNLMTVLSESAGDLWLHSDMTHLWWTRSQEGKPIFYRRTEPISSGREVVVCHKPCEPWRNSNARGNKLLWSALHPKARDFLATEATFQTIRQDYADYVLSLIEGRDLADWHSRPEWRRKAQDSKAGNGSGIVYNKAQIAAYRMAKRAFDTAKTANGQTIERNVKEKNCLFSSAHELEKYLLGLMELQEYCCAITGLPLNLDEQGGDGEMRASLDRIDSAGHYESGNLQVVCKFVNRWKGADDDLEFRRLLNELVALR